MLACGTAAIHRYSLLAECGLSAVRSALIKGRPASNETFGTGQRAALIQPQARTGRAYRSLALSTKHSVDSRRTSVVYEPVRSSDEVLGTLYKVVSASYD